MPSANHTTNHDEIRKWAEEKGGVPSVVRHTSIIRIDFKDGDPNPDEDLVEISWEEFFKVFEKNKLTLIYRDQDRFNKFVSRDSIE